MNAKLLWLAMSVLVAAAPAQTPDRVREAQRAIVRVIHLAPDGSDILRGNGFLISADGMLATNYHLVFGAARLHVQLPNGDFYDQVTVQALDPAADVAILKIPAFNAPHLAAARRSPPPQGEILQVIPRGKDAPGRAARLASLHAPAAGLELLVIEGGLDSNTKGCPVLDARGELAGLTTLTFQAGPGTSVAVGVNRLLGVLESPLGRALDLMDWSAWKESDDSMRSELDRAGLKRRLPASELRGEKNLARRLELGLAFDPTDAQAKTLLARAYIEQRAYEQASAQITQILTREPDNVEVLTLKGDLLLHLGDYDQARGIYKSVVEKGLKEPHNYDKSAGGVRVWDAFHDHAIGFCKGPIVLAPEELSYRPGSLDGFAVPYSRIKRLTVKPAVHSGQNQHEFHFEFAGEVTGLPLARARSEIQLRLSERESRDNLITYMRASKASR